MENLYKLFSSPLQVLEFALKRYFRTGPPMPLSLYLKIIRRKPFYIRQKIARTSHFPEVLDELAGDPDPLVQTAVKENDYWQLLGQYKALLRLTVKEKQDFISRESFPTLLVFIVFEKEPAVLKRIFYHPDISLPMLHLIRNFFRERGVDEADRRIFQLLNRIIEERKIRVYSLKQILGSGSQEFSLTQIGNLLENLLAEDAIIMEAAFKKLQSLKPEMLESVFDDLHRLRKKMKWNEYRTWLILKKFLLLLRETKNENPAKHLPEIPKLAAVAAKARLDILQFCAQDLSDRNKFRTIVMAHMDPSRRMRQAAAKIISLQEILTLVQDESFPQGSAREVIQILKNHPSPAVQETLEKIFVQLSGRIRKQLREMEASIEAYCDIIFDSAQLARRQQARQIHRLLKTARELALIYLSSAEADRSEASRVIGALQQSQNYFEKQFSAGNSSLNGKELNQLQEKMEIISALLDLPAEIVKNEGFSAENDGINYLNNLQKARLLWRSILGQYLGRFRELDDFIRQKWLSVLEAEMERENAEKYLRNALNQLEADYKSQVLCKLKTECKDCRRRNCAAERFLRQNEFLISELLDFLKTEPVSLETSP